MRFKPLSIVCAGALVFAGVGLQASPSDAVELAEIVDVPVVLRSTCNSNVALTALDDLQTPSPVGLRDLDGSAAQRFVLRSAGGNVQIVHESTGYLLTADQLRANAPVRLRPSFGVEASNWRLRARRAVSMTFSPLFADRLRLDAQVGGGASPTLLNSTRNCSQRFSVEPVTPVPTTTIPPFTTVPPTSETTTTSASTTTPATTEPPTTLVPTTAVPTTVAPTSSTPVTAPSTTAPPTTMVNAKWVRIEGNLFVDSVASVLQRVRDAKAAGANGIVYSDSKATSWVANPAIGAQWVPLMKELAAGIKAEGLQVVLQTAPTGYGTALLAGDPNLTTGYPIVNAPFTVTNGTLVPDQTANFTSGFESAADTAARGWDPDSPGVKTVIDTSVKRSGNASMRFSAASTDQDMARAFVRIPVKPFQQYTLRFWVKLDNVTAGYTGPYIAATANSNRALSAQRFSFDSGGTRDYRPTLRNETRDWSEMKIAFNSMEYSEITVALGLWQNTQGQMWVDDVALESTPLLNVVRRASLPLVVTRADGSSLTEGADTSTIVDPLLGQSGYTGNFETYHAAPVITVPAGSRLRNGDKVLVSGYHALVTVNGQVGVSWHEPALLDLITQVHARNDAEINADGYLIDFEEIRTGGWEPSDEGFGGSAQALAAHLNRIVADAKAVTGKPIYVWSDMLEPQQNAIDDFYQVKGSLVGIADLVAPGSFVVVNWKETYDVAAKGAPSLLHFAKRGFRQIIAGYYDTDVAENHRLWAAEISEATADPSRTPIPLDGSMYTTWVPDFSSLPEFGRLWWNSP